MKPIRPIDANALLDDLRYNKGSLTEAAVENSISVAPTLRMENTDELRQIRAERDALRKELNKLTKGSYS